MLVRVTGTARTCVKNVSRCGRVVLPGGLFDPHQVIQGMPRTFHASQNGYLSSVDSQHLQIDDDFFTHLTTKGEVMEGSLSLLLLLSVHWNDDASINHLLQEARAAGVRPSAYMMEKILLSYIKRKDVGAAISLYGRLRQEYVEASLDSCTVLHLCTILVEAGECQVALENLKEFVQRGKRQDLSPNNVTESCKLLLGKAADTGSYEFVKEILDLLLVGKLVTSGPQVVAPLLQCKLDRDDIEGTVEVAEFIYHNFNTLPKRMEILIRLMQHNQSLEKELSSVLQRTGEHNPEDKFLLGRMFVIVEACYGPTQARHDLLFACLESGHPISARLVLQVLAQDTDEKLIQRICRLYARNKREAALEHLLFASKGNTNIDRLKIYEILLDAYKISTERAGEKGLSLWTSMQEESIIPSSDFLLTLSTLLQNHGIKIPFDVQ